jgi:hypothetical protein
LALDRGAADSVRSYDKDGRLHVAKAHISKANVCPYRGSEIPGAEELKLDPDRVYQLLRDPDELTRAAATSNNVQLMSEHLVVDAGTPHEDAVAGSTGTDAEFVFPYLDNSLVIWRQEDIDAVESRERCELSCGYHYRADMTPGVWRGTPYDGVMRDIVFNHVALVEEGRAGSDVVVADSKKGTKTMDKATATALSRRAVTVNALVAYLTPRLAKDAEVSVAKALDGVTGKTFKAKRPAIVKSIEDQTRGKLAADATLKDMTNLMDSLERLEDEEAEDVSVSPEQHRAMEAAAHGSSKLGIPEKVGKEFEQADKGHHFGDRARDWMTGRGMSDDDISELEDLMGEDSEEDPNEDERPDELEGHEGEDEEPDEKDKDKRGKDKKGRDRKGRDEPPPFAGQPLVGGKMRGKDKRGMDSRQPVLVTEAAMDEKIKLAVDAERRNQREVREAYEAVRPWVGTIAVALDSAHAVHRTALEMLGHRGLEKIHPDAYLPILQAKPLPGRERAERDPPVALDAAAAKSFEDRFGTGRIGHA